MRRIQRLFLLLIFFSVISYVGYAIIALKENIIVNFSYSRFTYIGVSSISKYVRYIKDFLVIVILFLYVIDCILNKKYTKTKSKLGIYISFIIIILIEGIVVLWAKKTINLYYIISGMRGISYFFVVLIVALKCNSQEYYNKICKLLNGLLFFESIIVVLQLIQMLKSYGISYIARIRLCGTFGHCSNLGYFLLAIEINEFIKRFYVEDKKRNFGIICKGVFISSLIYISGTRSALILSILLLFIMVYKTITDNIKRNKIYLHIVTIMIGSLCIPFITKLVENISKRGSILEVNKDSGRIKIILDYISNEDIWNVLFGKGIGYGTNTAVIFNDIGISEGLDVAIMDGTINTIITQFGVITLGAIATFIIIRLVHYSRTIRGQDIIFNMLMFCVIGLMSVTINIFEEYSFLLILSYCVISSLQEFIIGSNRVLLKRSNEVN